MKRVFFFVAFISQLHQSGYAQKQSQSHIDSLLGVLAIAKEDTAKVNLYEAIIREHVYGNTKKGFAYEQPALGLAQKLKWTIGIAKIKSTAGRLYWWSGKFDIALKHHFEALDLFTLSGKQYIPPHWCL
jgi:hypothetical protein